MLVCGTHEGMISSVIAKPLPSAIQSRVISQLSVAPHRHYWCGCASSARPMVLFPAQQSKTRGGAADLGCCHGKESYIHARCGRRHAGERGQNNWRSLNPWSDHGRSGCSASPCPVCASVGMSLQPSVSYQQSVYFFELSLCDKFQGLFFKLSVNEILCMKGAGMLLGSV